jgi:hypothetical protein
VFRDDENNNYSAPSQYGEYGICYTIPLEESDGYRVVHIEMPQGGTIQDVLGNITHGQVYRVLVAMTARLAGCDAAFVTFVQTRSALALASDTKFPYTATLLKSGPTWPIAPATKRNITQGWTRCVAIHGLFKGIDVDWFLSNLIPFTITTGRELLSVRMDESGVLHLEFNSIQTAGMIYHRLKTDPSMGTLVPHFEEDPCGPTMRYNNDIPLLQRAPGMFSEQNASAVQANRAVLVRKEKTLAEFVPVTPVAIPEDFFKSSGSFNWADDVIEEEERKSGSGSGSGSDNPAREVVVKEAVLAKSTVVTKRPAAMIRHGSYGRMERSKLELIAEENEGDSEDDFHDALEYADNGHHPEVPGMGIMVQSG